MSQATNYLEDAVLNHLRGSTYTAPSGLFIKVHTGNPGEDATGNASAYTTRNAITFAASSGGTITQSGTVTISTWASGSETLSHFSIWDAASAGNPLCYGAFTVSKAVVNGNDVAISGVTVTLA